MSHKTFSKSTPPVCRCRGGTGPTKRSLRALRAPLQCVQSKSKKSKFNCKLANGSHQSRCIQYQDVQCAHGSNNLKIKMKITKSKNVHENKSQIHQHVQALLLRQGLPPRREINEHSSTLVRLHSTSEVYRYAAAPVHSQPSSAILIAC